MKTILIEKIDGYNIIIGIGDAQIDPVATAPIVEQKIVDTAEYKAVEAKKQAIMPIVIAMNQAKKDWKAAKTTADKNKFTYEYQKRTEEYNVLQGELAALAPALVDKYRSMTTEHAVYFNPKPGSKNVSIEEAAKIEAAMQAASAEGCFVDDTLKKIVDYRGSKLYKKSGKWSWREISTLGDKPSGGEIFADELTETQSAEISAQITADRIALLKPSEKKAEKESIISGLVKQAADMKSQLEISGDKNALKTAQDWYNAEVVKVEAIYG